MAMRSLVTRAATSALRPCPGAGMPPPARHQLLHAIPTQVSATPPMALRSTIAAALRCRSGTSTPATAACSRFFATNPARNQVKRPSDVLPHKLDALITKELEKVVVETVRSFSQQLAKREAARYLLELAERGEETTRRVVKWTSRGIKAVEWACYFAVSATVAGAVRDAIMPISMEFYGEFHDIPS